MSDLETARSSAASSVREVSGRVGRPGEPIASGVWFADRFQFRALLARSRGVQTWRGWDRETGREVVLRVVDREILASGAHHRLQHEASVLRQAGSDTLVVCYFSLSSAERLLLVYPFVPGISLRERLARGPLSVRDTLHIARRVLSALHDAHERSVLHSDVKPSNIILSDEISNDGVALLDSGFARSVRLDAGAVSALTSDTIGYLSPEQAGLIDAKVDERSDLYSLGVVLYECLAGACPFADENVGDILRKHLTYYPPALRERGMLVPRALDEVIARLLRKDPRDRYQTAEGALADLKELSRALDDGQSDPVLPIGKHDLRRTLTEPAFIGRRSELLRLRDLWQQARDGKGGLVYVESESGGGKTRFLQEFHRQVVSESGVTYRGQGLDQTAQRPFQVLVGIAEQAVQNARRDPQVRERLRAGLGEQREAACVALPELAEEFQEGDDSSRRVLGPEDFGEIRSLQALTAFMESLGDAECPALVLLDDIQWADDLTLKWIQGWQRQQERERRHGLSRASHLLIVCAFRSEEVRLSHPLRRVQPKGQIELPPFGDDEICQLVESMAGSVAAQTVEAVVRLAEGSPFMASAILRGLVESAAIVPEKTGWKMVPSKLAALSSSSAAANFLVRRLRLLPAPYLQLLSVGAVLGKDFELDAAARLSGQTAQESFEAAEEARRRHIVWPSEVNGCYSFVHDKLREALLSDLSLSTRRELHLKAAEDRLARNREAVFELAYHFDAAGDSVRALPYALAAAEQARNQHSLEIALQQYRIAERGAGGADVASLKRIAEGLGDVLLLQGNYEGAERQYRKLFDLAVAGLEKARIEGKLGEVAFKRGDVEAASLATERALRLLGGRVPASSTQFLLMTVWEALVQALHTLLPRFFVGRRDLSRLGEREQQEMRLLSRLAYIYWFQRGKVPCAWAHLREMNLAERYPPTPALAQAYSEHSPVMTMLPWFKRGIDYAERGLAIRRALGDLWGQGQSLHFYGVALYGSSQYEACIEKCREAVRLMERTGDRWEVNTANWHIAFCLYRLGDLEGAVRAARDVYQAGLDIDDHQATGIGLSIWARASGGNVPEELLAAELARRSGDAHTRVEVLSAEGIRLLAREQTTEAVAVFQQARAVVREAGLHQEYIAPVYPWLVTALRIEYERSQRDVTPLRRARNLRDLRKALREARAISRKYRNNLPHVLRESALAAALEGRLALARSYFDRGLRVAGEQGARFERQQLLAARARVGREAGWTGADRDELEAKALAAEILSQREGGMLAPASAVPHSLSLADRFDTLLVAGRRITSSLNTERIYETVSDAALKLLRGERCLLYRVAAEGLVPVTRGVSDLPPTEMLQRSLESGLPVIWVDGGRHGTPNGALRSALCAPFFVRGKAAGCFYVEHRSVGGLFGDDERRLAEFIASLTGAALDNAAGFAELQRLNESRKQDIAALKTAQNDLAQRAQELARSNTDLERFAYVASHDLKEPLRMVSSYVGLLQKRYQGKLDPEADEYIGYAMGGARRMYSLIDALLAYSRVSYAHEALETIDLNELIQEVLQNLQTTIQESHTLVEVTELPTIHANRAQILQLFQNLVGNAIKFHSEQAPHIRIQAKQREKYWQFAVRDNGIGIAPEFRERIFVIFQRLHNRDQYPGTGVGLAICKRIVELHRGQIWVDSEDGGGSTFYFTLPSALEKQT